MGWVEKEDLVWTFALNLDITKPEHARAREEIALSVLRRLGIY